MSLILTTAIEKGGTGKTTTVVNLAALMAAEGKRVLVVDMDQQANTTYMLTQHKKAENFYKGHGLVNMFMNFDLGGMDLAPYIPPYQRGGRSYHSQHRSDSQSRSSVGSAGGRVQDEELHLPDPLSGQYQR